MADVSSATHEFDLVLLGGGTGGYVAAIRATQLGLKVAVVEESSSAALASIGLHSNQSVSEISRCLRPGQERGRIWRQCQGRYRVRLRWRASAVAQGRRGAIQGPPLSFRQEIQDSRVHWPRRADRRSHRRRHPEGRQRPFSLTGKYIIINTGSRPRPIEGIPYDGKQVINSDHAVVLEKLPKSFIIRGGGATGVEWASVYHRYGTPTTLVGNIVPMEDKDSFRAARPAPSSDRRCP